MAWNSGGGGPWGGPGGGSPPGGRPPGGSPPGSPWGGGGRRRPQLPDPEQLLARVLAWLRGLLPGKWRGPQLPGLPGGGGLSSGRLAGIGAAIVVLIWLASGFYVVQPDQQGVVLRFGAFVGTTAPGLNYHLPWPVEEVLLPAVTRVNRTDIGFRPAPNPSAPPIQIADESSILTGDENIVSVNATVFWRISNPEEFLFAVRDPTQLVKRVAESSLREVIGLMMLDPVLTSGRAAIEQQVQRDTAAVLASYHAGVEVLGVQLQRVDPPTQVIPAFRDVQAAREDARRAVNQAEGYRNGVVPRARGQAAQIVAAAEGEKAALIAQATGAAKRFDSVVAAYHGARQATLERIYIETMQDVLGNASTVVVGSGVKGVLPMLPLTGPEAAPGVAAVKPAGAPSGGATPAPPPVPGQAPAPATDPGQ